MALTIGRDGSAALPAPTDRMTSLAYALDPATAARDMAPSFDQVYAEHVAFVWRTLRSFGVADAQLEDAVQDVFVVVHRRLPEWEGRAQITTWLFAIARRVASATRRGAGTRAERTESLEVEPAGTADTFAAMSRAQAAAAVMAILDTIDEDKRIVFVLVELEQMSVPEVAQVLDLKLNTAYSRLRLARAAFELAARAHMGGER
jgi:RNA polymerase sigma-70 factor (ECF subfamily)